MGATIALLPAIEISELAASGVEALVGGSGIASETTAGIFEGSGTIGELIGGSTFDEVELTNLASSLESSVPGLSNVLSGLSEAVSSETMTGEALTALQSEIPQVVEEAQSTFGSRVADLVQNIKSKATLEVVKKVIKNAITGAITEEIGNNIISVITGGKHTTQDIVKIQPDGSVGIDTSDPLKLAGRVADLTASVVSNVSRQLQSNPGTLRNEQQEESLISQAFSQLRNTGDKVLGRSILNLINDSFKNDKTKQDKFNQIWKTYNGQGLFASWEHKVNGVNYFYMRDETGKIIKQDPADANPNSKTTYPGYRSEEQRTYIYLGPSSYNNKIPYNFLDTIAQFHDTDWKNNGYFDLESDMRFASRCLQNLSRMGAEEASLAISASAWFLTGSFVVGSYTKGVRDLYSVLKGTDNQPTPGMFGESQDIGKKQFYDSFENKMDLNYATYLGSNQTEDASTNDPLDFKDQHLIDLIQNLTILSVA